MALVDANTIRTEQHAEIGDLINSNIGIILHRWSIRAVAEQPNAQRAHHNVLLDHLSELLHALAQSLTASTTSGALQHCRSAAKHGEERWNHGWSLVEVIR